MANATILARKDRLAWGVAADRSWSYGMATADDVPTASRYMDYAEHERTYRFFIKLATRGSITVAVIVILMAIFLV